MWIFFIKVDGFRLAALTKNSSLIDVFLKVSNKNPEQLVFRPSPETYLEHCQRCKIELLAKILNEF